MYARRASIPVAKGALRAGVLLATFAVILLALSGCMQAGSWDVHITVYRGERWTVDTTLSLTPQELAMIESQLDVEDYLEEQLAQLTAGQDGQYSWEIEYPERGGAYLIILGEGKGLEGVGEFLGLQSTIYLDESSGVRHLVFRYSVDTEATLFRSYNLRVTGGEIISSNADVIEGSTATWHDLTYGESADVVMTEASRFGCVGREAAAVHVTFYEDEEWTADIRCSLTWEELATIGGEQYIEDYLEGDLAEQASEEAWQYSRRIEYPESGGLSYIISADGQGFQALREAVLGREAAVYVDESSDSRRLVVHVSAGDRQHVRQYSLTLTGAEIISSNADEVDGDTAVWYDLSGGESADAVLSEASRFGIARYLPHVLCGMFCIGVLPVVVAGGVLGIRACRKRRMVRSSRKEIYCFRCGHANAPGSRFCISCGRSLS